MTTKQCTKVALPSWQYDGWFSPRYVGGGAFGIVHALSDKHVAKTTRTVYESAYESEEAYDRSAAVLRYEYDIQKELFSAGVQVPKPEGIFTVNLEGRIKRYLGLKKKVPSIVSQRIYGITNPFIPKKLSDDLDKLAIEQFERELEKANKEGFFSKSADMVSNTIFDPKTHTLYLIDFGWWVRK